MSDEDSKSLETNILEWSCFGINFRMLRKSFVQGIFSRYVEFSHLVYISKLFFGSRLIGKLGIASAVLVGKKVWLILLRFWA